MRKLSGALPVFAIVGQVRARFGHHFLRVGLLGFGVLALAFGLTAFSLANGVHCPGCDRMSLSDAQFAFWERYFLAKDGVYLAATLLLGLASPLATPRRWPFVVGLVVAFGSFALTPL